MSGDLRPRVKTEIDGEGSVIIHDRTRYGLCRMCVAMYRQYPNVETWVGLLPDAARPLGYRYTERLTAQVFIGYLWIYYKIGR